MSTPKKKMSAAKARRRRASRLLEQANGPEPLPADLETALGDFVPRGVTPAEWLVIIPMLTAIMRGCRIRGSATFRQHLSDVTLYLRWALRQGHAPELGAVLRHSLIDEWARTELAALENSTRNTRRSRLRSLATDLHPGPDAPARGPAIQRTVVKPPYEDAEVDAIVRIALTQPSQRIGQQLCAMVGLGLGAGLDSTDLRPVRVHHIDDRGEDGLWVTVLGPRPRLVPVRRAYAHLVTAGCVGLGRDSLLSGREASRNQVTASIVANAVALGSPPHIEQTRLRSTWLTHLMCAPVPVAVILTAAGLVSARTLTDLLPYAASRYAGLNGQEGLQ